MTGSWAVKKMTVFTLMEQRKNQKITYFRCTDMLKMTVGLIDVTVKHCQKETVNSSLLSANMFASYTLRGSTEMHSGFFWSKRKLCKGKREKGCSAGKRRLKKQSHLPFHELHRYHHFEVIRISVFSATASAFICFALKKKKKRFGQAF